MNGDDRTTYLAYLSRTGRLPPSIKSLIGRYHIHMYDDHVDDIGVPTDAVNKSLHQSELSSPYGDSSLVVPMNFSCNNNDDDLDNVDPAATEAEAQSPPPPPPCLLYTSDAADE